LSLREKYNLKANSGSFNSTGSFESFGSMECDEALIIMNPSDYTIYETDLEKESDGEEKLI